VTHRASFRGSTHGGACAALALVAALGCASSQAPPPQFPTTLPGYRLGAPDQLLVTILPDPEVQRSVTIRPDGMISIDLVGDVPAAGRTTEEIAEDIQRRIRRYRRDAAVTVSVVLAQSVTVTIFGQVGRQQSFPLQRQTRIAEALAQAGGVSPYASESKVKVIRTDGTTTTVFTVDLDAIFEGDLSTNILLADGDIIYVPPTVWAQIGIQLQVLLFPIQQVLGGTANVAGSVLFWGGLF
jgi:polysaccharide export outer membrane protein